MQFTRSRLAHSLLTPNRAFLKGQGSKIGRFPTKHFSSVSTVPPVIEKLYQTIRPPSHPTDIILKQDDNETIRYVGEALQAYFISGQRLPFELVTEILRDSTTNFKQLPNILPLKIPTSSSSTAVAPATGVSSEIPNPSGGKLNVCGDTHGQFYDFCEIFDNEVGGYPSLTNHYLFNGDIVDRGPMALEIFLYLLTIKLISSNTIHILRGNHESIGMTNVFGFKNEIKKKYFQHSNLLMNTFYDLFHSLPIGAVIEEKVFVTHGGLGPSTFQLKIDEINQLNRFNEPDDTGVIGEFLWGDPTERVPLFAHNSARGGGYCFGKQATNIFLSNNNLQLIIRSHEVKQQGYEVHHDGRCLTVFSAPHYYNGNKGALFRFGEGEKVEVVQFTGMERDQSLIFGQRTGQIVRNL